MTRGRLLGTIVAVAIVIVIWTLLPPRARELTLPPTRVSCAAPSTCTRLAPTGLARLTMWRARRAAPA